MNRTVNWRCNNDGRKSLWCVLWRSVEDRDKRVGAFQGALNRLSGRKMDHCDEEHHRDVNSVANR